MTVTLARTTGSSSSSHRRDSAGTMYLLLLLLPPVLLLALPAADLAVVVWLVAGVNSQCHVPSPLHPLAVLLLQLLLGPRAVGAAGTREPLVLLRARPSERAPAAALLVPSAHRRTRASRLQRPLNSSSTSCRTLRMWTAH